MAAMSTCFARRWPLYWTNIRGRPVSSPLIQEPYFGFRRKRPDTVRGHLITKYTGQKTPHPVLGFLQENLLTNFLTVPDFIAMDIKHREMHAFQLCRLIYNVMEVSWTVRSPEQAQLIKDARGLIIFEAFEPQKGIERRCSGNAAGPIGSFR